MKLKNKILLCSYDSDYIDFFYNEMIQYFYENKIVDYTISVFGDGELLLYPSVKDLLNYDFYFMDFDNEPFKALNIVRKLRKNVFNDIIICVGSNLDSFICVNKSKEESFDEEKVIIIDKACFGNIINTFYKDVNEIDGLELLQEKLDYVSGGNRICGYKNEKK